MGILDGGRVRRARLASLVAIALMASVVSGIAAGGGVAEAADEDRGCEIGGDGTVTNDGINITLACRLEIGAEPDLTRSLFLTSFAELEARIGEVVAETTTPGLGIVVVSPEEILWAAGLGVAGVASGTRRRA